MTERALDVQMMKAIFKPDLLCYKSLLNGILMTYQWQCLRFRAHILLACNYVLAVRGGYHSPLKRFVYRLHSNQSQYCYTIFGTQKLSDTGTEGLKTVSRYKVGTSIRNPIRTSILETSRLFCV